MNGIRRLVKYVICLPVVDPWAIMHCACSLEIKVVTSILPWFSCQQFDDVTTSKLAKICKCRNSKNIGNIRNSLSEIIVNGLQFSLINSVEKIRQ